MKLIEKDLDMYQMLIDTVALGLNKEEDEEKEIKEHDLKIELCVNELNDQLKNIQNSKFSKIDKDLEIYEKDIFKVLENSRESKTPIAGDELTNLISAQAKFTDIPNIKYMYLINKYKTLRDCKCNVMVEDSDDLINNYLKLGIKAYIPEEQLQIWYNTEKIKMNKLIAFQKDFMAPIIDCLTNLIYYKNDLSNANIEKSISKVKQTISIFMNNKQKIPENFNNFNLIKNIEKIIKNYEQLAKKDFELKNKINNKNQQTHDTRIYAELANLYSGKPNLIKEYRANKLKALFIEARQKIINEFIKIRKSKTEINLQNFEEKYKELSDKYRKEILDKIENDKNYMLNCDENQKNNLLNICKKLLNDKENDFFPSKSARETSYLRLFNPAYAKGFVAKIKQRKQENGMSLGR